MQKLAFNQVYFENLGLNGEELTFLHMMTGIRPPSDGKKKLTKLARETPNMKLTDYLNRDF